MSEKERNFLGEGLKGFLDHKTELYVQTIELSRFITTISGIVLTLALGRMTIDSFFSANPFIKLGVFVIVGSSLFTICMSLLIIEPNIKKDRDANTFDEGKSFMRLTKKEYLAKMKKTASTKKGLLDAYAREFHKIDHIILKRFQQLRRVTYLFLFGLLLGGFLIIWSSWIVY